MIYAKDIFLWVALSVISPSLNGIQCCRRAAAVVDTVSDSSAEMEALPSAGPTAEWPTAEWPTAEWPTAEWPTARATVIPILPLESDGVPATATAPSLPYASVILNILMAIPEHQRQAVQYRSWASWLCCDCCQLRQAWLNRAQWHDQEARYLVRRVQTFYNWQHLGLAESKNDDEMQQAPSDRI